MIIFNPSSGKSQSKEIAQQVQDYLEEQDSTYQVK